MKSIFCYLLLLGCSVVYGQKPLKDFYLSHSLKQENEQYQFKVLDEDKRGVFFYKKDRFYYWYKAQRVLSTQGGASGTLLHGEFESFYPNKQLCRKGEFRKGLKEGEWLYWRQDGTLFRTERWRKGRLSGTEKHYNEQGEVIRTIEHKSWSVTDETADSTVVSRRGGKRQTIYHKNDQGKVYKSEQKKNNRLHGKVMIYDDEGKLMEKTSYRKGQLVEPKVKEEKEQTEEAPETVEEERKWWQIFKKKEKEPKAEKDSSADKKPKKAKKEPKERSDSGNEKGKREKVKPKKEKD